MVDREIMTVCSEIHTKHIHTLYLQNVELFMANNIIHKLTTLFQKINIEMYSYWKCLYTLKAFAVDCGHIFNV